MHDEGPPAMLAATAEQVRGFNQAVFDTALSWVFAKSRNASLCEREV